MTEPDGGAAVPSADLTDEQIVERVLRGDDALFEIIMRRHNQRLYRAARGISARSRACRGRDPAGLRECVLPPEPVRGALEILHVVDSDRPARRIGTGP